MWLWYTVKFGTDWEVGSSMDLLSNTYVLIAALVVVVALMVLLIVLMRRRRSGTEERGTAAVSGGVPAKKEPEAQPSLLQAQGQGEAASLLQPDAAAQVAEGGSPEHPSSPIPAQVPDEAVLVPTSRQTATQEDAPTPAEEATQVPLRGAAPPPPQSAAHSTDEAGQEALAAGVAPAHTHTLPSAEEDTSYGSWMAASEPSPQTEPFPEPTPEAAPAAFAPAGPLYDPVSAAVTSLLQNEGDLAPAEMRRLDLYKPERILQVVRERKEQASGRQRMAHLSRLEAIEKYATTLASASAATVGGASRPEAAPAAPPAEESAPPAATGPAVPAASAMNERQESVAEPASSDIGQTEDTAETEVPAADAESATSVVESEMGASTPPTSNEVDTMDMGPFTPTGTTVDALQVELQAADLIEETILEEDLQQVYEYPALDASEAEQVEPVAEDVPEEARDHVIGEPWFQAPAPQTAPEPLVESEPVVEPGAEALAEPGAELLAEPETAALAETETDTDMEIPLAAEVEEEAPVELQVPDEAPPHLEAERAEEEPGPVSGAEEKPEPTRDSPAGAATTPQPAPETAVGEPPAVEVPEPQPPLPLKASDVIALPPRELIESLPRLDATELELVFAQAETPAIKRSVIDALGALNTPDSLLALQNCLDDPDSVVQAYALEMADKMLGSNS
jgi:hypothetical protein